jgi:hypothetical protein
MGILDRNITARFQKAPLKIYAQMKDRLIRGNRYLNPLQASTTCNLYEPRSMTFPSR